MIVERAQKNPERIFTRNLANFLTFPDRNSIMFDGARYDSRPRSASALENQSARRRTVLNSRQTH